MKKVTKLVSFCAAVTMAVTAIPASSLILAKAAANDTTPTVKVGTQFVSAGEEYETAIKPELYNANDLITEGLSLAFKTGADADPATAALMSKWTYRDLESSSEFNDLGSWKVNDKDMVWATLTNGTSKIGKGVLEDGMSPLELWYDIPDEATINSIAQANNMEIKQTEEGEYYYEFPLEFDPNKKNEDDGCALLWGGENATEVKATYIDGSICVKVSKPYPTPTTTTTTSGTVTTTTTTTTTTTSGTGTATTTSGTGTTVTTTTASGTGTTTTTTKNPLTPLYGDVNVNGQVTIIDVVLLNKAVAGKVTLGEQATLNADCVHDGVINELDAKALLAYLVGWDGFETLPVTADAVSTLPL